MKKLTGVLAALASAAAITVTGTSSAVNPAFTSNPKASAAVDTNNDDWLHAEGSRLYDMNGNEVWQMVSKQPEPA